MEIRSTCDQQKQSYQSEKTGDQASLKTKSHKKDTTGLRPLQLVGEIVKFSRYPKPQIAFKGLKQLDA